MQCVQSPGAKAGGTEEIDIALKPGPGIPLRVVDGQNQPVSGAQVQYIRTGRTIPEGNGGTSFISDEPLYFTRIPLSGEFDLGLSTADDGTLPLPRPCGGIRWIEVSAPNRVKQRIEIPENDNPLTVTLPSGVDVKVTLRSGGRPMVDRSLSASSGTARYDAFTDASGNACFKGVAMGPLKVNGHIQLHMTGMPENGPGVAREFLPKGELDLALLLSRRLKITAGAPAELAVDLPPLEEVSFKISLKPAGDFGAVQFWSLGYVVPLNPEGDRLEGNSANTAAAFTIRAPKQGRMLVSACGVASREEIWYGRLLCELDKIQGDVLEIPVRCGTAKLTGEVPPACAGKHGMISAVERSAQNFLNLDGKPSCLGLLGATNGMAAPLEKNGQFRMPSLPPGQYDLYLTVFDASRTGSAQGQDVVMPEEPTAPEHLGFARVPETGEVHFTPGQP
jgi:hypothetical protein